MPRSAPRPCRTNGCPAYASNGSHCPAHQGQQTYGYSGARSSTARGYGIGWQRGRTALLSREPLCRICAQAGKVALADTADHIIPKSRGGTDDPSNLQPLCTPCHDRKTARESNEA